MRETRHGIGVCVGAVDESALRLEALEEIGVGFGSGKTGDVTPIGEEDVEVGKGGSGGGGGGSTLWPTPENSFGSDSTNGRD